MSTRNEIHAENIVNSTIRQGSEEDPGFVFIKLSPKGIVTGSTTISKRGSPDDGTEPSYLAAC